MKNQILSSLANNYFKHKEQHKHVSVAKDGRIRLDLAEGQWINEAKAQLPDRNALRVKSSLATFLGVKPENISVFAGADEAIEIIPRLFLNPGDNALVVTPIFDRLITTNLKVGAKVSLFKLTERTNFEFEREDVDKLSEKSRAVSAKLIWLCSPNNPTGRVVDLKVVEKIAKDNAKSLVVLNEVYQEYFSLDKKDSSVRLINKIPNLIVIRSFSKAFNLAGLRVGYVVSNAKTISYFESFRTMYNVSSYAQDNAVAVFLPNNIATAKSIIKKVTEEREILKDVAISLSNFKVVPESKTNFLFIKHRKKDLFVELYKKGIVAGDWREALGVEGLGYIRLSVSSKSQNNKLISVLKEIN